MVDFNLDFELAKKQASREARQVQSLKEMWGIDNGIRYLYLFDEAQSWEEVARLGNTSLSKVYFEFFTFVLGISFQHGYNCFYKSQDGGLLVKNFTDPDEALRFMKNTESSRVIHSKA
jgi:hypothetical protein